MRGMSKHTQTDWYIMPLNEIDAALTELGLQTKLVFLIYFELLWPPKTVTLKKPRSFSYDVCSDHPHLHPSFMHGR